MSYYKNGEALCKLCLEARGYKVIDRTQEPQFWIKDIDFTAVKDGKALNIEVKWDNRISRSGTMFLELMTNLQENKLGWARYTAADYIWYGDASNKIFYIFPVWQMRNYLDQHYDEYETRRANDYKLTGEIRKTSLGAIVPLGSFKKYVRVQEMDIQKVLKQ